jgi:demethoxyubiquinone hydroxylase (CLK1/Coq7/Cat5 family)
MRTRESQSVKAFLMDAIMKFGESANNVLNPNIKTREHITTIRDIDFDEVVSDETEKNQREHLEYYFKKLYDENRDIPSLLKSFFKESASFTITK